MEVLIYAVIFIIGTVFGSFFTLAVYRIPLKKDITHERSFCPNCNHRLEFLDLIPVLSYVFLGGKCRYCKQKIRPRYVILEILSGLVFLIFALGFKINIYNMNFLKIPFLIFGLLYISSLFIIAGIDKEHHLIPRGTLIFGLVIDIMYIIYLYILRFNIYKYVIYLILMFILIILDYIISKKKQKQNYTLNVLALCMYLVIALGELFAIIGIIISLLLTAIKKIMTKQKEGNQIPIAFYLCITNIIILIVQNLTV